MSDDIRTTAGKIADLHRKRVEAESSKAESVEKRHAQGKYTARERIEKLVDPAIRIVSLTITEGGYTKAVKAIEQVASVIWLGARHSGSDYFSAVVDYSTFNDGAGTTTTGQYGALADALYGQLGGTASSYQSGTSVYTTLNGDGTWAA